MLSKVTSYVNVQCFKVSQTQYSQFYQRRARKLTANTSWNIARDHWKKIRRRRWENWLFSDKNGPNSVWLHVSWQSLFQPNDTSFALKKKIMAFREGKSIYHDRNPHNFKLKIPVVVCDVFRLKIYDHKHFAMADNSTPLLDVKFRETVSAWNNKIQ